MTTSAEIRNAWRTYVFEHTSIKQITSKFYDREITQESEAEVTEGYSESEINFFEYVVTPIEHNYLLIGGANSPEQTFTVEVRYTKYALPNGSTYNEVVDAQETLLEVVKTSLGNTWQGLIDFVESPIVIELPQATKFNETDCYRAVSRFTAIKQI